MIIPDLRTIPEKGFYYHANHDPRGEVQNCAYEVIGVGVHTERDREAHDANMVVYLPLYDCPVSDALCLFLLSPLSEWMGEVVINGRSVPRFTRITDPCVIAQLRKARAMIYGKM